MLALTLALAYGIWYSYSVILVALLAEFGWSRSVLAGAFSVFTLVHGGMGPIVGALGDRVKPLRMIAFGGAMLGVSLWVDSFISTPLHLFLGFGVLTAVAVATCGWVPALVQVQRDFQDRIGLAIGIVSSGVGVGMLLVVPLCQLLIDAWGWRVAYRVIGVLCVLWIVPSSLWLLRTAQTPAAAKVAAPRPGQSAAHSMTLGEAARTAPFWLMLIVFFLGNTCAQTLHVHQVAYLVDHGVAAIAAAMVVGVVGAASIVGKTGGGWLSDRFERELIYATGIGIMLAAIVVLLALGTPPSTWAIYAYAVLLGMGYSVTAALVPAMVSDRFSGPHFGSIVGVGLMGSAVGSAAGPWMAGFLFDLTGSYLLAFLIAGACGCAAGIAGWRARVLRVRA